MGDSIPNHIAIIMDGNGRWAKSRGLPRLAGHEQGAESVRQITRACRELGVRALTLYAFSEQNWARPASEVSGLMRLLARFLREEWSEIMDNGIRLVTIGETKRLPAYVRGPLSALMKASEGNGGMVLCLALSYGGREEITHAAKRIAARVASGQITLDEVDPAMLDEELHHRVIPWDPDLVIRTSGEQRLSNFLLWQSAYAELFFTDVTWPEFGRSELLKALAAFRERERRYGKVLDPDPEDRTPPHKAVAC